MSNGGRHVASLVATFAEPKDMDLLIQTLEESEFIRVRRINAHYADIIVDEGDHNE